MITAALGLALGWIQDPVMVEIRTPRSEYYLHEGIPVALRFAFERKFRETQMLSPFRRPLDLPVDIEADWLTQPTALPGEGFSFVLNGSAVWARFSGSELHDGQTWDHYSLDFVLRAEATGAWALPAVALRYAVSSAFTENPIQGRIAVDREDRMLATPPLTLSILPLPIAGQPASFRGAVGKFEISATAAPVELAAGDPLQLMLRISGACDPHSFEPPDLSRLPGLELRGQLDDRSSPVRELTYEFLLTDAGLNQIPPIDFAYFDPGPPAGYRVVNTEAVALRVRGSAPVAAISNQDRPLRLLPIRDHPPQPRRLVPAAFALALLIPATITIGAWLLRRAQERDRRDPEGVRARRAAGCFSRAMGRDSEMVAAHFADYLAARLRLPTAAPIAPDPAARLTQAGLPPELARHAADTLESLVAARYGGPPCADGAVQARARVRELELHFRARGRA